MRLVKTALAASLLALAVPSQANVVLSFDDLADFTALSTQIAGFSFGAGNYVVRSGQAGGSGNYFNNPSSPNALGFFSTTGQTDFIVNVTGGFGTWFRTAYSSASYNTQTRISIYDGLNGKDAQGGDRTLATSELKNFGDSGCPSSALCNWTSIGLDFTGTAYSVRFENFGVLTAFFDNLDFGNKPGNTRLPEPAGLVLAVSALGIAAAARRRRQA